MAVAVIAETANGWAGQVCLPCPKTVTNSGVARGVGPGVGDANGPDPSLRARAGRGICHRQQRGNGHTRRHLVGAIGVGEGYRPHTYRDMIERWASRVDSRAHRFAQSPSPRATRTPAPWV